MENRRAALPAGDRAIREAEDDLARCRTLLDASQKSETPRAPAPDDDEQS